jgi:glycosyltransferase involved in cell wall biosynthesis
MPTPSARPLRVLLVGLFPPTVGGITAQLVQMLEGPLAQRVDLIPFNTSRPPKKRGVGDPGYRALLSDGLGRLLKGAWVTLQHLAAFPGVLRSVRPDVVHVHTPPFAPFWESALYVWMAKSRGLPVILHFHYDLETYYRNELPFLRPLIWRVIERVDRFVVLSEKDHRLLEERGYRHILVLPPSLRVEAFSPRAGERPPAPPLRVLFVGGKELPRKGIDTVLEAARILKKEQAPVRFSLAALSDLYRERLRQMGLEDWCEDLGWIFGEAKYRAFRSHHVLVLPSRAEGMPMVLMEAMAAGMAIVATPVGGIPDIVQPGYNGVLIPVDDPYALSRALWELALEPSTLTRYGHHNRTLIQTQDDLFYAGLLTLLYEEVSGRWRAWKPASVDLAVQ